MNLGIKIRTLRKARGVTQEELGQAIGISFQSVSKWENQLGMPDITLLPALAAYFGITMDELFDFNLKKMEEHIQAICQEAFTYRETDAQRSRQILEDGLKQYPDNEILLNNLLYVMDYSRNPDQTIAVASKLIDETSDSAIRYDALRFLAYAFHAKGDMDGAASALEQIPELYFTKLTEAAYLFNGQQKYEAAEKQKWISFENLLQMMWKIAECHEADGHRERAAAETKRALALIGVLETEEKIANFKIYQDYFDKQIERMEAV